MPVDLLCVLPVIEVEEKWGDNKEEEKEVIGR